MASKKNRMNWTEKQAHKRETLGYTEQPVGGGQGGIALGARLRHLNVPTIIATGMSGKANVPTFSGQDVFKGEQQHSSQH